MQEYLSWISTSTNGLIGLINFHCNRCSTLNLGELTGEAFNDIFGFGSYLMSFSSQLHSLELFFGVFSLCMESSELGGILVFGEIVEPGIVFTPLVSSP